MKEMLLGIETEYALSGPEGPREQLAIRLVDHVSRTVPSLPGLHGYDRFLANGSRFYIDCGAHPELSTPECSSPSEALRYIRAGEEILTRVINDISPPGTSDDDCIQLFRCNVDYSGAKTTWGSHESYLHEANPVEFPDQIIPHLVSRVIYTGAGGLNPFSAGIEFTLSPRAWHLHKVASGSSTDRRGIFHYKNEPLAKRGFNRLHLLCGETLCSDIATWLRVGTTAIVVAMIDAGLSPGRAVQLRAPLEALRAFVSDPDCRITAETGDGRRLTALNIQRHYLSLAEANLDSSWMPVVNERSLSWDMLRPFVDLRRELFELDFRFGQLGERGFFGKLDRAGVLEHRIKGIGRVDLAVNSPPPVGRARVRGRRVKKYTGREGYQCYWDVLYDLRGARKLNLSDPFLTTASWRKYDPGEHERRDLLRMMAAGPNRAEELLELMRRRRQRR
ncbi:MAG: proteasome accessory factor PafA2 family protein [bacterium]